MIEDKEFGALFRDESEEHLQSLESGLLRLEQSPGDEVTLKQVFRSAHSLKGAARMLGVETIEAIGHHFETALGEAANGQNRLTAQGIERLYGALDAVRALVEEAVSGTPSGVDVEAVLARLGAAPSPNAPSPNAPSPDVSVGNGNSFAAPFIETEPIPAVALPRFREEEGAAREVVVENLAAKAGASGMRSGPVKDPAVEPSAGRPADLSNVEFRGKSALSMESAVDKSAGRPAEGSTAGSFIGPERISDAPALAVIEPASLATIAPTTPSAPLAVANWKIETIRVEPAKLDALLSVAGELVVTATRAHRGLAEIEAATALWEEWSRATLASRRVLADAIQRDAFARDSLVRDSASSGGASSGGASSGGASSGGEASHLALEMRRLTERESQRLEQVGALLERLRGAFDDVDRLQSIAGEVEDSIHNVRLLPLSTVFGLFNRPVRDLAKAQQKEVQLLLEGGETAADKRILEEIKDPLMHLIRNAVDHGIEAPDVRERLGKPRLATLSLRGYGTATQIVIELRDDGRGLDTHAIRASALRKGLIGASEAESMAPRELQNLIFLPGFSTAAQITDVSGRGVGLDVVRANVEGLRGGVDVESWPGAGCLFRLSMPATLATTRVLLVRCQNHTYALPIAAVHSVQNFARADALLFKGRVAIAPQGKPIPLVPLASVLGLGEANFDPFSSANTAKNEAKFEAGRPCILLEDGGEMLAVLVDSLVDEEEIVLKPLDALLRHSRLVAGTTILDSGEVCLMLNPQNLVQDALLRAYNGGETTIAAPKSLAPPRAKVILLAEDSITTRTQEKRILEGAGYQVVTAVDGLDAWHKLAAAEFDAVVSDIEMPNLTGLELAERIRADERHRELPIILVTSLASEADRKRGVEVGANAYITKGTFDQKALLDILKKLA